MRKQLAAAVFLLGGAATVFGSPPEDYARARELLKSGHPTEAAAIYRRLSDADAANADLLLNLSIALYQAKDFHGAAGSAAKALQRNPDLLPARLFLGASRLELGDAAQAAAELERVVAANPAERNARLLFGKALLAAREPERAAEQLEAAVQMLPGSPDAWYSLARAREALGQKASAAQAWQQLAALPPSPESHRHTAESLETEQRWQDAALEWQEVLKLRPDDQSAKLRRAGSLYRLRDYSGAMAVLKPLLAAEEPEALFLYGGSLMNLQQPAEAIPYLRSALARRPGFLPATAALGQALLQTGKPDQAIPLLREAAAADQDGSAHFQLFRAYQLTGLREEADRALGEYQRIRAGAAGAH